MKDYFRKINRSRLFNFLCGALLFYAALILLAYFAERSLVFQPDTRRMQPAQYNMPNMDIISVVTEDGLNLEGWYAPPEPGQPVIVFFQGNAGHIGLRNFKARPFMNVGHGFLFAAYRGYSGNPGRPYEAGVYRDARAYLDWLINVQGIKPDRIVLYGESLGTGVAVRMAIEYPNIAAMILETPYTSLPDVAQAIYFFLPMSQLMRQRFDSLALIEDVRTPLIIVHGTYDVIVPHSLGAALYEAANEPKEMITITGGGHVNLHTFGVLQRILEFVEVYAQGDNRP